MNHRIRAALLAACWAVSAAPATGADSPRAPFKGKLVVFGATPNEDLESRIIFQIEPKLAGRRLVFSEKDDQVRDIRGRVSPDGKRLAFSIMSRLEGDSKGSGTVVLLTDQPERLGVIQRGQEPLFCSPTSLSASSTKSRGRYSPARSNASSTGRAAGIAPAVLPARTNPMLPRDGSPRTVAHRRAPRSSRIASQSGVSRATTSTADSPAPRLQDETRSGIAGVETTWSQAVERTGTATGSPTPSPLSNSSCPALARRIKGEAFTTHLEITLEFFP